MCLPHRGAGRFHRAGWAGLAWIVAGLESDTVYRWIKKLHIYSGLLSYVGFTVWGIVGIWASFAPAPAERPRREPEVRTVAFQVDGGATDH